MGRPQVKFNYAASDEELQEIQKRVQRREKSKTVRKGFFDSYRKRFGSNVKDEDIEFHFITHLYIHTAFELGVLRGRNDMNNMIDHAVNTIHAEREKGKQNA